MKFFKSIAIITLLIWTSQEQPSFVTNIGKAVEGAAKEVKNTVESVDILDKVQKVKHTIEQTVPGNDKQQKQHPQKQASSTTDIKSNLNEQEQSTNLSKETYLSSNYNKAWYIQDPHASIIIDIPTQQQMKQFEHQQDQYNQATDYSMFLFAGLGILIMIFSVIILTLWSRKKENLDLMLKWRNLALGAVIGLEIYCLRNLLFS